MLLSFLLSMAAGATARGATGSPAEPNLSFDPTALLSCLISADREKAADAEHAPPGEVTRKLWRTRVAAPVIVEDVQTQIDLAELIQKIRSVKFGASGRTRTVEAPSEPMVTDATGDATPAPEDSVQQTAGPIIAASSPEGTLPVEAAEALKVLLADPNQASDPLEMAERPPPRSGHFLSESSRSDDKHRAGRPGGPRLDSPAAWQLPPGDGRDTGQKHVREAGGGARGFAVGGARQGAQPAHHVV
jgi:hypothetical protein